MWKSRIFAVCLLSGYALLLIQSISAVSDASTSVSLAKLIETVCVMGPLTGYFAGIFLIAMAYGFESIIIRRSKMPHTVFLLLLLFPMSFCAVLIQYFTFGWTEIFKLSILLTLPTLWLIAFALTYRADSLNQAELMTMLVVPVMGSASAIYLIALSEIQLQVLIYANAMNLLCLVMVVVLIAFWRTPHIRLK